MNTLPDPLSDTQIRAFAIALALDTEPSRDRDDLELEIQANQIVEYIKNGKFARRS